MSSLTFADQLAHAADTARFREPFQRLVAEWKEQSRFLSNTAQMAMIPAYQRIIGMGPAVVPLILEELGREPGHWFWALEAITGENPVAAEKAGSVRDEAKAWIDWGREQGLIP